ncbi:MAG: hypothetical protein HYY04_07235 [Chloroflexi bacterium]|nr:hypothetical protein [Chloroflexota bacterium]
MFQFRLRGTLTVDHETQEMATCRGVTESEVRSTTGVGADAVAEAVRVIQKHVDKEARNRWVEHLEVRDLCPRQKADLVAELAQIFR